MNSPNISQLTTKQPNQPTTKMFTPMLKVIATKHRLILFSQRESVPHCLFQSVQTVHSFFLAASL